MLLNRKLFLHQWISLFTLTLGVGILLHASDASSNSHSESGIMRVVKSADEMNTVLGSCAVIASCLSSGFASTYFERLLRIDSNQLANINITPRPHQTSDDTDLPGIGQKRPVAKELAPSLWIRNVQLSLWGLLATLPLVIYKLYLALASSASSSPLFGSRSTLGLGTGMGIEEWSRVKDVLGNEFFKGFNKVTWIVIALQVIGGLLGGKLQHSSQSCRIPSLLPFHDLFPSQYNCHPSPEIKSADTALL